MAKKNFGKFLALAHESESAPRNYVPLGEKKEETAKEVMEAAVNKAEDIAGEVKEEVSQEVQDVKEEAAKVKEKLTDAIGKAATTIDVHSWVFPRRPIPQPAWAAQLSSLLRWRLLLPD